MLEESYSCSESIVAGVITNWNVIIIRSIIIIIII